MNLLLVEHWRWKPVDCVVPFWADTFVHFAVKPLEDAVTLLSVDACGMIVKDVLSAPSYLEPWNSTLTLYEPTTLRPAAY